MELPKSRRAMPHIQSTNWLHIGLSRPSRARSMSIISCCTMPPSPAMRTSTMSPGSMRMRMKMTTATPRIVGSISSRRFRKYCSTSIGRQPDVRQALVQVVARAHFPALEARVVRHGAMPPEDDDLVRFGIQHVLVELAQQPLELLGVGLVHDLLVQRVDLPVLIAGVLAAGDVVRQELGDVDDRVDHRLAVEVQADVVFLAFAAQRGIEGRRRLDPVLGIQADLAPLIDQPDTEDLVGLLDAAVVQPELEALGHAGFLEQAPRLGARLLDVGPIAGDFFQL